MPNCTKCGAEVEEGMIFCPKCGAPMKLEEHVDWRQEARQKRREWREQRRAARHAEKSEKTEKHGYPFIGPIIGGAILLSLGALLYYAAITNLSNELVSAFFFVAVGIIVVVLAAYAAILAARRHPRP